MHGKKNDRDIVFFVIFLAHEEKKQNTISHCNPNRVFSQMPV